MNFSLKLSDVCHYVNGKIAVSSLNSSNYISTENMLPNKEGIVFSTKLPTVSQAQAYNTKDILISNIRPYFRKIWFANQNGGCSNDVLVLRAKENYHHEFLYYLLSSNDFFDYTMATSKGTKMPRGDKDAIMKYVVPDMPIKVQISIADTLSALDSKITINKRINHHLSS